MRLCIFLFLLITTARSSFSEFIGTNLEDEENLEKDGEISKKIIGSSVVTSVSVILNGDEPQFTDAIGKLIPKPMVPLQVASPINLLNPDRYEFYTFDDNGELVKRLMTLKEIQSIVANGDGEGSAIIHNAQVDDHNPEKNVQDIVQSVQNVLTKEVEWKKNSSNEQLILDTPDVSSSWSMILPAIFGNTGGDIFAQKPQQVVMAPESDIFEHAPKPSTNTVKPTKQKPVTTKLPSITDADVPQKIFVNNEERIKTSTNRVETTTTRIHNLEKPQVTIKVTTKKPIPMSSTKIKPAPYSTTSSLKRNTTTSETSTIKNTKLRVTSAKPTITTPIRTTSTTIKPTTTTIKPTTTTTTTIPPIIPEITTLRITTARVPPIISQEVFNKSTTTLATFTDITPSISPTVSTIIDLENDINPETEFIPVTLHTETTERDDEKPTSPDNYDEISTINNILQSLSQDNDDKNTKISFDQILESLKDNELHSNEILETQTHPDKRNLTDISKISQNAVDISSSDIYDDISSSSDASTTQMELVGTTVADSKDEQKDVSNYISTTMPGISDFDDFGSNNSLNSQFGDESSVVMYEPLYVELRDPVLTDITTNFVTTELPATTTTLIKESSEENELELLETANLINISSINQSSTSATFEFLKNANNPKPLIDTIDKLIANNTEKFEDVTLNPENIELVLERLKTNANISMSDFKLQAATVASSIENIPPTSPEPTLLSLSSSPDKPHEVEDSDEIESLLSDVLNQMTDPPLTVKSEILEQEESANRLSNMAHINTNLFSKIGDDHKYSAEENTVYERLDTITPQKLKENSLNENHMHNANDNNIKEGQNNENSEDLTSSIQHKPVGYAHIEAFLSANKEPTGSSLRPSTSSSTQGIHKSDENNDVETTSVVSPDDSNEDEITTITNIIQSGNGQELVSSTQTLENENDTSSSNSTETNNNDKKHPSSFSPSGTTEVYPTYDSDDSVTYHTTESDPDIYDDEKFSLISTTLMFLKDENKESTLGDPQYMPKPIKNDTKEEATVADASVSLDGNMTNNLVQGDNKLPSDSYMNNTETEHMYVTLGEPTEKIESDISNPTTVISIAERVSTSTLKAPTTTITTTIMTSSEGSSNKLGTLKPVHYFKQPLLTDQKLLQFNNQRPVHRPPLLNNLKISQQNQPTRPPVKLDPTPEQTMGLEASTLHLEQDVQEFAHLCNELAFTYWKSITAEKISPARSLVLSPFALTSMLSMMFLGARGSTSGEMNEILKLDDMVTFNPHLIFKNITESTEHAKDSGIASSAFVREIFSDRVNGKILQFFKEKTQQLYSGHVEEVNFNVVNDIIRRRTNLLIKRHTMGKMMEYLRTNSVWVNGPLATVSANVFQTDCSKGSVYERDGEMFFQVHPSIRQRRLIPIPAVVFRSGFTAGYDPELDATIVAFGKTIDIVSTIYIMPGQQGLAAPGDNLERLEHNLVDTAVTKNSWSRLLTSLIERPGLEIQLPRFSHRSFINASMGLQRMGLKTLFSSKDADLRGLTGLAHSEIYLSDMVQINTFSTCAEEKISDHHHVEMYPAPPLRRRNAVLEDQLLEDPTDMQSSHTDNDNGRAFYDDLLNPKYLELPLPLRPRQARIPDSPRLRFDKPFLYFVRHNPTGMILFMGRFNPRLLP